MTAPHAPEQPERPQAKRILRFTRIFLLVVIVGMAGVLGRVVQLKVAPDPRLDRALGTPTSSRIALARRGDLLDRKGRLLATSTIGYRLFVDPHRVDDPHTIAVELAAVIQGDAIEIDKKITAGLDRRYVVIRDLLDDWQVEAVRHARLNGVGVQPRLVRHYPHGDLAAGLIGKVGFEHTGLAGLEHTLNRNLWPSPGRLTYLRDVQRHVLWVDQDQYQPGRHGVDIRLSLDLVIQEIAETRLQQAIADYHAGGGRIVVLDCQTGELLAMADPLNPRPGWDEHTNDPAREIHPALGRNRCVTDPYEPGSTLKPFIWAVATELHKATLEEELPIPDGPWKTPYGRIIHEAHYYGPSTWRMVLVKSMNIGMAMMAERMTHREMQDAVRRFGFGAKTDCGLPGESAGMMTPPKEWRTYTQTSVAMGHEIAVTPLQIVRAFSAFARDGTLPELRVTAMEQPNLITHRQTAQDSPVRAISEPIALLTREVMKGVMEEGTGRKAQSEKYQLFGKSGTAQLPRRDGRGYHDDRYVSTFIAGAPFAQPRIVVLCVIDDPDKRKGHLGGAIAGPVVRDVIDETLAYLGVPPDKPREEDQTVASAN